MCGHIQSYLDSEGTNPLRGAAFPCGVHQELSARGNGSSTRCTGALRTTEISAASVNLALNLVFQIPPYRRRLSLNHRRH